MSNTSAVDLNGLSQAFVALVAKAANGVVTVKAGAYRTASGVRLKDNIIAVANHTLRREGSIPVHSLDGNKDTAKVLGRDSSLDVAFLKLESAGPDPLPIADTGSLKAGAMVSVVGLTIDAGPSASFGTLGAVSGARRIWRGGAGTLDPFLRLDVNLYPSQSGAAVVNMDAELIGMATPGLLRHSTVAVPVGTLNRIAEELLKEGRIRYGYLGIGLQPVAVPAALREKLGLSEESGLMILSILTESPAEKAGLQLGDILLSLDGKGTSDVDDLQAALKGDAVGRTVKAMLIRGGERLEASLVVAERPRASR